MNKFCAIALLAASSAHVAAEEDKKLSAEIELGVIATSGNTNTQSFKGSIDVKHDLANWKNHYLLQGLFKRDEVEKEDTSGTPFKEDDVTAEKYFASVQSDYKINKEHAAFFGYAEYDRNRFSGFDYQYTFALGYTDRLFTNDNSYLSYDVGPGVTVDQPEEVNGVRADSETNFIIRLSAEYLYELSDNATFTQNLSSNYATNSDDNTKTKSVTAINAQINSSFTLRASYTVDYNSEVTEGRKHADTETAITLVYSL